MSKSLNVLKKELHEKSIQQQLLDARQLIKKSVETIKLSDKDVADKFGEDQYITYMREYGLDDGLEDYLDSFPIDIYLEKQKEYFQNQLKRESQKQQLIKNYLHLLSSKKIKVYSENDKDFEKGINPIIPIMLGSRLSCQFADSIDMNHFLNTFFGSESNDTNADFLDTIYKLGKPGTSTHTADKNGQEIKSKLAGLKGLSLKRGLNKDKKFFNDPKQYGTRNYRVNIAIGGLGELSLDGKTINSKGGFGTLLVTIIKYKNDKNDKNGKYTVQLSIEPVAPHLKAEDTALNQTHSNIGASDEFSVTGSTVGKKDRFFPSEYGKIPRKYDGLHLDFSTDEGKKELKNFCEKKIDINEKWVDENCKFNFDGENKKPKIVVRTLEKVEKLFWNLTKDPKMSITDPTELNPNNDSKINKANHLKQLYLDIKKETKEITITNDVEKNKEVNNTARKKLNIIFYNYTNEKKMEVFNLERTYFGMIRQHFSYLLYISPIGLFLPQDIRNLSSAQAQPTTQTAKGLYEIRKELSP
jgi:hypothetical protein